MPTLITWNPQLSLYDMISKFHDKKVEILFQHLRILMLKSVGVRDLFFKFSQDVKSIELTTLLMAASYIDSNHLATIYLSTTTPPDAIFNAVKRGQVVPVAALL
ncbi:hypothetical protein AG4045_000065 [Apium graveolens]|uniref:Uncharacterized protein n=1 Tax=Apium graveolens TaxID=4045 RepID=A0A6L5B920_APIGR|nr:hypothetical protein AG4045_000065 [Apium graveolens]